MKSISATTASGMGPTIEAASKMTTSPVRVWDLPTRVFHWSLALSFAGAWLTAESERWRDIHVMLGYTMAGLIAFRLVWGLMGSRYARFSSFIFSPAQLVSYFKSLFGRSPEHHVGHNPGGALAIFALLGLGAMVVVSGYSTYAEMGGEWLEELHEGASTAMLGLVFIHLAGVALSSLVHKENLVRSMVTGWKNGRAEVGIERFHVLAGGLLLSAVIGFVVFAQTERGHQFLAGTPESNLAESQNTPNAGGQDADQRSGAMRNTEGKRSDKHGQKSDDRD